MPKRPDDIIAAIRKREDDHLERCVVFVCNTIDGHLEKFSKIEDDGSVSVTSSIDIRFVLKETPVPVGVRDPSLSSIIEIVSERFKDVGWNMDVEERSDTYFIIKMRSYMG